MPPGFTWVEHPALAALALPHGPDDFRWLRAHGVQVVLSLTEDALPRAWVNDAGLLAVHVPVADFAAPSHSQFETCLEAIGKAHAANLGVAVHCAAGKGRTGTVLAAYFVARGLSADDAIRRVRELRPGSVETREQEQAVARFAAARADAAPR